MEGRGVLDKVQRRELLDNHVVGSDSLPQVEDGVTMGIIGNLNRQYGSQTLEDRLGDPHASLADPDAPSAGPELLIQANNIAEPLESKEHSLLIGAVQSRPKAGINGHISDPGASDTALNAAPETSACKREAASEPVAPEGFFLVTCDSMV